MIFDGKKAFLWWQSYWGPLKAVNRSSLQNFLQIYYAIFFENLPASNFLNLITHTLTICVNREWSIFK